ncbi:amidohydrolase family protein [Undibacterium cyanobacteriorum]|uniref:Amidohydrolase family protein n=1 Tax=Undibacterium cyanobacteriorum TaxID=3073561 RepID=A0ABY9RKJ4_9BURK|nr:amidohydrolase family protein [Undibacterium sp. 20NA77.5]WMW81728.1 amidohydrolase family protein [Undibacterium sp. 20NA77.5]
MTLRPHFVLLALGLCSAPSFAQQTVVDCGKLLDVKAGVWRDKMSVVIENKQIKSIVPSQSLTGEQRVDLSGYHCLPGLIDMHVHLSDETKPQVEQFRSTLTLDSADIAFRSIKYAERTLMAGFTSVRDLGASDGLNISLKRAIENGDVQGPRMFTAGKSIATTGGHADPSNGYNRKLRNALGKPGPEDGVVNGVESAREAIRSRYQEGADLIKITATAGVLSQASSGDNTQFSDEELQAIVSTAKDYGFRVAAHAHGNEGIKRALRAGIDSIEHGTYMDDEAIALFKQKGAWYVPTISAGRFVADKAKIDNYYSPLVQPKAAAIGPRIQSTFARAIKAGVKIAFGTDAGVFPHGDNAKEFGYMVEAGMTPLAAIRSATLSAAELLNQSQRLGSLEAGFAADMIAVKVDPLKDVKALESVAFVMKDGRVVKSQHK